MLHVHILMVGKTKEAFIQEGVTFYARRLQPFFRLTLKSVREEKERKNLAAEVIKTREGDRLRAQIPPKAYAAALDPRGLEPAIQLAWAWATLASSIELITL